MAEIRTAENPAVALSSPRLPVSLADMRFVCLLAALFVYALGGTPTPDSLGAAEMAVGLLLLTAAGGWKIVHVAVPDSTDRPWRRTGRILMFYGLTIPVMGGLFTGNDPGMMLRDVVAFLFLLLPLAFSGLATARESYRMPLTIAAAAIGLMFALRVLSPFLAVTGGFAWRFLPVADPGYLANAPTVLFSCLLLAGFAGKSLYEGKNLPFALPAALASLIPFAAMAMVSQRASMGLVAAALAFLAACGFVRRPARMIFPALALLLVLFAGYDVVAGLGRAIAEKTALVGFNMRFQEAAAVLDTLGDSIWTVLFGRGWGAAYASPAVGGLTVNFTHSLLTTYWLKTGLIGLCLVLGYLYRFGLALVRLATSHPVVAVALAAPFVIDVTLYASFKSLDFGLILLLTALWADGARKVAPEDAL